MSYRDSELKCDWCGEWIGDGDSVACEDCHKKLEARVDELEDRVAELERDLSEAEAAKEKADE